jgi:hypothetical protein
MTKSELVSISAPSSMSLADPHPDAIAEAAANVVAAVNAVTDVRFTGHLHVWLDAWSRRCCRGFLKTS